MDVSSILRAKGSTVETIAAGATVGAAAEVLARRRIGALVVSEDGASVDGVISERDIVHALTRHGARLLAMPVGELMTRAVITCEPSDSIESLMGVMTRRRIRHIPVVAEGRLVGIVSIGDVVKHRLDDLEAETTVLRDFITRS